MAASTLGHAVPPVPAHRGPAGCAASDLGPRPDDLARPGLGAGSITLGFALALLTVLLLVLVVTGGIWWFGAPHIMRAARRHGPGFLTRGHTETLEQRVVDLTVSRAETVDHSAAELRRIERDLHDGAQARLVALGMTLGMADQLFARDPEAARKLLAEARDTTGAPSATCAPWSAASTRRCSPTAVWPVRCRRSPSTWPLPVTRRPPSSTGGRRSRSSRRPTSRSPSASPTSASTPRPTSAWVELSPRRTGCCAPWSVTTGAAAPTRARAPGCGGDATAGGL